MKILVVDDDAALRESLEDALRAHSHEVRALDSGADALESLDSSPPDVLVAGLGLADVTGERVAQAAAALPSPPRIVLVSTDLERLDRASALADAVFLAPFDLADLLSLIEFYHRRGPRRR